MEKDNGDKPAPPPRIKVDARMDLQQGLATFTEVSVNGIVSLKPLQIAVPIQTIIIMAAQAVLAMNGIASGPVQVSKEGTAKPGSKLVGPNEM